MKLINNGILKCVKSDVTQLRSKKYKRYILVTGVKYNRLVAESNLNDNKCKRGTFLSEPENIKIFVKNIHFCSWHKSRILEVGSCQLGRHPVRNCYLIYWPLKMTSNVALGGIWTQMVIINIAKRFTLNANVSSRSLASSYKYLFLNLPADKRTDDKHLHTWLLYNGYLIYQSPTDEKRIRPRHILNSEFKGRWTDEISVFHQAFKHLNTVIS